MHVEVRKPAATKLGQQPRKLQRPPCERFRSSRRRRWRHTHIQLGGRVLFVALCVPFERQSHVPARKPRDARVKVPLAAPARGFCPTCQEPAVLSEPARKVIRAPDIGPPVHAIGQDVHAVLLTKSRKQRNIVLHLRKLLCVLRAFCAGRSTGTCRWSTETCRWCTRTCCWCTRTCCWYRQAHWVRRHVVCFLPTNAANAFVWRL